MTAIDDDQWTRAFESVFLGAVRLAPRASAQALGEGGSLALVLSSSVRAPLPGLAISNGLRPGLAMVAKTLADELGPRGIRVNGLLPGRVGTERVAELDASTGDPEAARAARDRGRSRWAATASRRSSAGSRRSCCRRRRRSSPASMLPVDGGMLRAL